MMPESKVVPSTLVPNIVYFECEAEGFVPPIITWKHSGQNVNSDRKYLIRESDYAGEDGGYGRRSTLTLLSIDVLDTGTVTCQADAPDQEIRNVQIPGDRSTAYLTVLGEWTNQKCLKQLSLKTHPSNFVKQIPFDDLMILHNPQSSPLNLFSPWKMCKL